MATRASVSINRSASPMNYLEETLEENREIIAKRKKKLIEAQSIRSPFLIGTIEDVNKRISKLEWRLQNYTELVVESRASERSDDYYISIPSASEREPHSQREKENKEVNKFAGVYAIKSTFLTKPNQRAKHVSKISMQHAKQTQQRDTGKPKFVELHQYPGYNANELTPLPHSVSPMAILAKVAKAQTKLKYKSRYKPEFERLFYSHMSQAMLQDTFWWIFLERWQSNAESQQKLFNRVAHNYVKLLTYASHPQYRDTFLKDYPVMLAQAIYAAFCEAFPDSYRQFNNNFKEDLVVLVHEWLMGLKPAPRSWMNWNFELLEPPNIKMREEMINQAKAKKKASLLNFDFAEPPAHMMASQSTLNQLESVSSSSSVYGGKRHGTKKRGSIAQGVSSGHSLAESCDYGNAIKEVAKAQEISKQKSDIRQKSTKSKKGSTNLTEDCLSPIKEFDENEKKPEVKVSKISMGFSKSFSSNSKEIKPRESHPACRGPDFIKGVFNANGQSPLVAHFLRMKNLQVDAGMQVRIQRTQLSNLPPLDAPTYRDVMDESFKKVRDIEQKYQSLVEKGQKESAHFVKKLKATNAEYSQKEGALLARPREIKRLSDLIMLELKKDEDSVSAGAAQALEAALQEQD